MRTEIYLKLAVLAAILIIALAYPVVSALVLTGVAAWGLRHFTISEMALVEKVVRLTPPGIKALLMSHTSSPVPSTGVKLALPAPDAVRNAVPAAATKAPQPVMNQPARRSRGVWLVG